jgi:hypothetical protein
MILTGYGGVNMAAAATVTVENNSLALSSIKGAKADAEKGYKRKRERTNKETNQYTKKKRKSAKTISYYYG